MTGSQRLARAAHLKLAVCVLLYAALFTGVLLAVDLSWADITALRKIGKPHGLAGWYAVPDDSPGGRMDVAIQNDGTLRVIGRGLTRWGAVLVAPRAGLTLSDDCPADTPHTHDASPQTAELALAFDARQDASGDVAELVVAAQDRYTTEESGICTKCSDQFSTKIQVPHAWRSFVIALSNLRQEGWGVPARAMPDAVSLVNVALRFRVAQDFDVSLRNLRLVRLRVADTGTPDRTKDLPHE